MLLLGPFTGKLSRVAGCTLFCGTLLLLCCQLGRVCGACRKFLCVTSMFSAAACFAIACSAPGTQMLCCLAFSNNPHCPCIGHTQTCLVTSLSSPHRAAPEGRRARHRNGMQGAVRIGDFLQPQVIIIQQWHSSCSHTPGRAYPLPYTCKPRASTGLLALSHSTTTAPGAEVPVWWRIEYMRDVLLCLARFDLVRLHQTQSCLRAPPVLGWPLEVACPHASELGGNVALLGAPTGAA